MKSFILLSLMLVLATFFAGCQKPEQAAHLKYDRPLPPGQLALRKITDPRAIPDFTAACQNLTGLKESVARSLNYLNKPSSKKHFPAAGITHMQTQTSLIEFSKLLDSGLSASQLNRTIRQKFDVYISVGCDNKGTVLFTGYYTPIFNGSTTPDDRYRYPLYKTPKDLVKGLDGAILGRRLADGQLTKYPPRSEIDSSGQLTGTELVWLTDPFEAYIAHVQGSAKIRTPDGELKTVGYSANNGHPYRSISKELVKDGRISSRQLSLSTMINYFKRHKDMVNFYTRKNPRYVFFQNEAGPPRGSLNEPVTKMRTIATDKSIFPRGSLTFLATSLPMINGSFRPYTGFALDQDTGGAIRAAGRCDVYMGQGDSAGKLAGNTYQQGKLYYLFLKPAVIN